jgi:hypothetical protein
VALRTFFLEGMFEAGWGRGRRSELGWQEKWGGREKWTGGNLKLVGWEGGHVQAILEERAGRRRNVTRWGSKKRLFTRFEGGLFSNVAQQIRWSQHSSECPAPAAAASARIWGLGSGRKPYSHSPPGSPLRKRPHGAGSRTVAPACGEMRNTGAHTSSALPTKVQRIRVICAKRWRTACT